MYKNEKKLKILTKHILIFCVYVFCVHPGAHAYFYAH